PSPPAPLPPNFGPVPTAPLPSLSPPTITTTPFVAPAPPIAVPAPPIPEPGLSPAPPIPEPGLPTIDPKTPLKDLLPAAPRGSSAVGPLLTDDLNKVPEVQLHAPWKRGHGSPERRNLIAKINHLNDKK